jgi:hypothetical protein
MVLEKCLLGDLLTAFGEMNPRDNPIKKFTAVIYKFLE